MASGGCLGVAFHDPGGHAARRARRCRTAPDRFRITFGPRHFGSDLGRNLGDRAHGSSGPAAQHVLAALLSGQRYIELVQCHLDTRPRHQRRPDHCHPRWPVGGGRHPARQSLDVLDATHRLTDTVIVDHWIASGWPGRRQQPCHRLPQRELGGSPERRRRCACGLERTGPFDPADADDRSGVGLIVGRTSLGSRLRHCRWLRRDPSLDRWWMPACRHGMPVSFRTSQEQPRPRTDCYGPFSTRPCMTNSSSNLPAECRRPERIVLSNARYQRSPRCRHSLRRCPRTCVWPSPWRPGEGCGEARYPHYGAETLTLFGRRCASNVHRWN